ncbi:type II secretion system minor pseudopilin GspK [Agaribacter flavus]|uniref:Type II secretion system minor pseudopilin GspK n=1 Tax=Agaribacter flavus TaxID=1902781 RepID=A0ABV7FTN2_9ALTE
MSNSTCFRQRHYKACRKQSKSQAGVALIVVLLIVALVSILAMQMTSRLQLNIARTSNIKNNNQAYWYALGAEQFAKQSLLELVSLSADNINLNQPWAQDFEYPVDGGVIKAKITDMQSCFNLNGVLPDADPNQVDAGSAPTNNQANTGEANNNPNNNQTTNQQNQTPSRDAGFSLTQAAKDALNTLLSHYVEDSLAVDTVRDSLIDWIDADDFQSDFGAEAANYESLPQPYAAANDMLANTSELRLINGVDELLRRGWLRELLPQVCVIPERNFKLNVNTVSEESAIVLAALLGVSVDEANQIISSRPEDGFADRQNFLDLPEVSALSLRASQANWFDVTTRYFKLYTQSSFDNGAQFSMATVFKVNEDNTSIRVISREFGGI